jgi:hypothetical protein
MSMKDIDGTPREFEQIVAGMDLSMLDGLIAFATRIRGQKHAERMARLQEEAQALGATVKLKGGSPRRGRKVKQPDQ